MVGNRRAKQLTPRKLRQLVERLEASGRLVSNFPIEASADYDYTWFCSINYEVGWYGVTEIWEDEIVDQQQATDPATGDPLFDNNDNPIMEDIYEAVFQGYEFTLLEE